MMNRACDPKLVNAEFADLMLSIFGKTPKTSDLSYTGDFRGFSINRESLIYYSNYRNYKRTDSGVSNGGSTIGKIVDNFVGGLTRKIGL